MLRRTSAAATVAAGAALLWAAACGGDRSARDAAGIAIDLAPLLSIGVEDGEAPYQFDRVSDAMRTTDGRYVVSNAGSGELRIFDSTGTYVGTLGRRGAGPMEFGEFSSGHLYANAQQVIAADEAAMRVHVLAPDLTFRGTRLIPPTPDVPRPFFRALAADGTWIVQAFANGGTLRGQPGQVLESSYQLLRYDSLGALVDTIIGLPSRPRIVNEFEGRVHFPFLPLAAEPLWTVDGDRLIIVGGNAPALQVYALDGSLITERAWDRPRVRVSEIWEEYRRQSNVAMRGQRDSARYDAFHRKAIPRPEYAPLYTGVQVDPAGRIWLERFRMPLDSTPQWDVLDRDGTLLGSAESPRGVTVLRFAEGLMIGRARDSLGVERVQVFRVR